MTIRFYLNGKPAETDAPAGTLLLDHLRLDRRLVGTKEGCKEGDCGACAVMIGTADASTADASTVRYDTVTSCLVPLGEVHGRHVVTVEGLRVDELSPVQAAIVEFGGTQCGYCTPGIAVSMAWWMLGSAGPPTIDGAKRALSGHLCRCTGYASLERAAGALVERFSNDPWAAIWNAPDRIDALVEAGMLPHWFQGMAERLDALPSAPRELDDPTADVFVAGGTDLYVQQGARLPGARVRILNNRPDLQGVRLDEDTIRVGAATTFEAFGAAPEIRARVPQIDDYLHLIASLQIRNRATLAGNIVNASPIGDMTILLLALDAELEMVLGDQERRVALRDFFVGYKTTLLEPGELITAIHLPAATPADGAPTSQVHFEKVSKRTCLDIATVNAASSIRVDDTGVIAEARFAVGGVAPIPLYLRETSSWLVGQIVDAETVREAAAIADGEIAPISDVRGSAVYKRLLNRQLFFAHFLASFPDKVTFDGLCGRAA